MQGLRRGEIELDRCAPCGGMWFDRGELEALGARLVQPLRVGPLEAHCAGCLGALMQVRYGSLPGAACGTCDGVFIEAKALATLSLPGLGARHDPTTELRARCPGCSTFVPLGTATETERGWACAACSPGAAPVVGDGGGGSSIDRVDTFIGFAIEGVLETLGCLVDL